MSHRWQDRHTAPHHPAPPSSKAMQHQAARHEPLDHPQTHPAPPPPKSFDPHLVASSVPARPRATSGKRHPMLRMGEVIVGTALVLLLSVGAVTTFVEGGIDAGDLALPDPVPATNSGSREPLDSRTNDNAAVGSAAEGDAVFDDPGAAPPTAPPAEAVRPYPALRPVGPAPSAATSPAATTNAPAPAPGVVSSPPAAPTDPTPPAGPAAPTDPVTPADPAPVTPPVPEPPAGPDPAPEPVPDPVPAPDPAPGPEAPPEEPLAETPEDLTVPGEPADD